MPPAATYPGGEIRFVEARLIVGGRVQRVRGRPQRLRGDRTVTTLSVRFGPRGTVGVDVSAEGAPLDRRCGERPALRRSLAKTLVARVR